MKVTPRVQTMGIVLYSLPFLAIIGISLFFVWAGDSEMILAGVALLPAVLFFCGVRWCRFVVGVFSLIAVLACSMIPMVRGTEGKYFWLVWSPVWLVFAVSSITSFIPARQRPPNA